MKKSELYHLAQIAVVTSPHISPENKLEILGVLIDDERLAAFTEKREGNEHAETV